MKKLLTVLVSATFFAITFSLIDQFVWHNDFYWFNAGVGFLVGAALVILGSYSRKTGKIVI